MSSLRRATQGPIAGWGNKPEIRPKVCSKEQSITGEWFAVESSGSSPS